MCISSPKIVQAAPVAAPAPQIITPNPVDPNSLPAAQPAVSAAALAAPAPTQNSADGILLGTNNIKSGIFGRLALTGGQRALRAVQGASAPTSGDGSTASSPGGTIGSPSDYGGLRTPVSYAR